MSPAPPLSRLPHNPRAAAWLWRASGTALVLMPIAMAVANRSSIAFLVLAALCALAALGLEGGLRQVWADGRRALATPVGLAVLAFAAWTVLSLAWSGARGVSLHFLGEFWLPVAAAFLLGLTLPQRMPKSGPTVLLVCLVVACGLIVLELTTNVAALRGRGDPAVFNRSTVTALLLSIPLFLWFFASRTGRSLWRGAVLAVAVGAILAISESGAAAFGAVAAVLAYAVARPFPRLALTLGVAASLAVLASAPVLGPILERAMPQAANRALAGAHAAERIAVWTSFGAVARAEPWIGQGYAVSARLGSLPVAQAVPPERRDLLAETHPHNSALQIWVELGAVGAVLVGLGVLLILRSLGRCPPHGTAAGLTLFAAAAGISVVSHGAWQGWWAAVVGAAIVWLRCTTHLDRERSP